MRPTPGSLAPQGDSRHVCRLDGKPRMRMCLGVALFGTRDAGRLYRATAPVRAAASFFISASVNSPIPHIQSRRGRAAATIRSVHQQPVRGDLSPSGSRFFEGEELGWQRLWLNERQVLGVSREHFGLKVARASLLAEGALNQTWRLHDHVLRVSRKERTVEQVAYERTAAEIWHAVVPQVVVAESRDAPVVDGHALTLFRTSKACRVRRCRPSSERT